MHHHALLKLEKGCRRRWPAALPSMLPTGAGGTGAASQRPPTWPIDRASTGLLGPQLRGEINLRRQGGLILCPPAGLHRLSARAGVESPCPTSALSLFGVPFLRPPCRSPGLDPV